MAGTSPAMTSLLRSFRDASLGAGLESITTIVSMESGLPLFHERARWLHVQRIGVDLVVGARIDFGHDRIVPGDDAVGMAGKTLDDFPSLEHVAEIIDDRKRTAAMHVGVVMRSVRRQHHRTSRSLDPHHLQAVGMAADAMQRHAGRELAITRMKADPLAEDVTDHQR